MLPRPSYLPNFNIEYCWLYLNERREGVLSHMSLKFIRRDECKFVYIKVRIFIVKACVIHSEIRNFSVTVFRGVGIKFRQEV